MPVSFPVILGLAVVYLVWGSTYLAIRYVVEALPPFLTAGVRFLVAGTLLYAWRRLASGDDRPTGSQWFAAGVVGLLMLLGGNGAVVWAEQYISSGQAALLVATLPLWMLLLEAAAQRNGRMIGASLPPLLLGFAGVAVLIWQKGDAGGVRVAGPGMAMAATLAVCGGSLSWAAGSLYSRTARMPGSAFLSSGMQMLCGGLGLLGAGLLAGEVGTVQASDVTPAALWSLVYLVIAGSLLGFATYIWLLRNASSTLVSTYAFVNPLVAVALGCLVAGEPFSWRILAGGAAIIGCIVWIFVRRTRGKTKA